MKGCHPPAYNISTALQVQGSFSGWFNILKYLFTSVPKCLTLLRAVTPGSTQEQVFAKGRKLREGPSFRSRRRGIKLLYSVGKMHVIGGEGPEVFRGQWAPSAGFGVQQLSPGGLPRARHGSERHGNDSEQQEKSPC